MTPPFILRSALLRHHPRAPYCPFARKARSMTPLHILVWFGTLLFVGGAGTIEARSVMQAVGADEAETADADNAAHERPVRRAVYNLYLKLYPPCPFTPSGDQERLAAPARAAFADFRREVGATRFRSDFEGGVRDAEHYLSVIDALCGIPPNTGEEAAGRQLLAQTRQAIADIRAQMRN
jgi:hypothetical protein